MAFVVVKDRVGAVVARFPRNTDAVQTHLTTAQCNTLKSAIESLGRFPADGCKFDLGLSYPPATFTSSTPLDTGYTVAVVTGDAWD